MGLVCALFAPGVVRRRLGDTLNTLLALANEALFKSRRAWRQADR
ncbi:hypothetical protein U91I_01301 [alpha proteobacterium U9-1i]|nr:hypothetical protein U91I_01301 [alpha proteobacterium U9-1i]